MSFFERLEPLSVTFSVIIMTVIVIISSMAVVYSKYMWRTEFSELQLLENKRDKLDEEWGKLLLEESTWASPARVEQQARLRLNMIVPTADMKVIIKP